MAAWASNCSKLYANGGTRLHLALLGRQLRAELRIGTSHFHRLALCNIECEDKPAESKRVSFALSKGAKSKYSLVQPTRELASVLGWLSGHVTTGFKYNLALSEGLSFNLNILGKYKNNMF